MTTRLKLKKRALRAMDRLASVTSRKRGRVVVLCYHSVHPHHIRSTRPTVFRSHLAWVRENCDIIPFDSARERAREDRDRVSVAITFDDGYSDNYEYVIPMLLEEGLTGTFFVTVGFIDGRPEIIRRIADLMGYADDPSPLRWEQLQEMVAAGMQIGSHTWSHPNLAMLDDHDASVELTDSKFLLEDRLGQPIEQLAYPFGKPRRHFSAQTMELARKAGYRLGASILYRTVRPTDDPLSIPRIFVTGDDIPELEAKIVGKRDLQGAWQERAPLWLAKLLAPEDFSI